MEYFLIKLLKIKIIRRYFKGIQKNFQESKKNKNIKKF